MLRTTVILIQETVIMRKLIGGITGTMLVIAASFLGVATTAQAAPSPPSGDVVAFAVHDVWGDSVSIRSQPNGSGSVVATMTWGDRFRVDDYRDNVWVFGAGYRNGNLLGYGFVLRQYLS
ncbi:hypothetical protein [Lentzea sp.]|uniref:SH3 domain-containing protein n=1 Tax=Lentzea sp. TaxID=56099 RepID=UPI002C500AEC|nr:hypothetical protein [Lentzea sp.]HUQ58738.1 hypothetical protein [Lentzea sp.]